MNFKNFKLDKIDLSILENIQTNGRMTNVELARRAGISAPPCLRRVNTLEEQGIISSYQANLDPATLGFAVTLFCEITLSSQNDSDVRAFELQIQQWPLVRECYVVTGSADFLLKIVAQDFEAYQEFLSTHLSKYHLVSKLKSLMVIRTPKKQPGVPIELLEAVA